MRKLVAGVVCVTLAFCSLTFASAPSYVGHHASTVEDISAINKIVDNFQTAIRTKNPKLLSTLVLNSKILFMSPASPEGIKAAREEFDTTFDGIVGGGYFSFANFLDKEKGTIEEKFYNVSITQDANVSWVMFDFEFLKDEKVINHGVEVWQMMKTVDGSWKIVSVVWSSKGTPKDNAPD